MKKLKAKYFWTHLSEDLKKKKKKEGRKEKKENVYGSTQQGTDMKHFFNLIAAFNYALSNPFSFPLVIFWIVVNAQSS